MKILAFLVCLSLYPVFCNPLKCYDCYVDGPRPLDFLRPTGPDWSTCSGVASDVAICDGGLCAELMLYGNDIAKYQMLRACTFNEDVCDNYQIGNNIYVGKCRLCEDDYCNNQYK